MNIIEIKNVTKRIGKKKILDNISFSVSEGDIFGFIGPNGAGKSTLIKTMLGLYRKTSGTIIIGGENVDKDFEGALKNVGAIIENPDMYSHLTGMQNLQIFADMRGGIKKDKIMEYVKLVKLENRIHDRVKTYSLGMKQRLGLVQALMHDPKLLILDEPTNGLDPIGIIELRAILKKINKEYGTTIFVSSHILSELENVCNTIAIIDNGKIIDMKSMSEIKKGQNRLLIEVDDPTLTRNILENNFKLEVELVKDNIVVNLSHELIPDVIRDLVKNDIDIYQIKYDNKTLEDEFVEKTIGTKMQIK
jgi:ABC-2 type transport system ATP-binding protein